jgi:hypothetical protein
MARIGGRRESARCDNRPTWITGRIESKVIGRFTRFLWLLFWPSRRRPSGRSSSSSTRRSIADGESRSGIGAGTDPGQSVGIDDQFVHFGSIDKFRNESFGINDKDSVNGHGHGYPGVSPDWVNV